MNDNKVSEGCERAADVLALKEFECHLEQLKDFEREWCRDVARLMLVPAELKIKELTQQVESLEKQCALLVYDVDKVWQSIQTEGSTIDGYIVNVHHLTTLRQDALSTTAGRDYFKLCPKCGYEVKP